MKTEKFSAENKWQQTQFNEKNGEIWKKEIKKYCKYNILKYKDKMHCSTHFKIIEKKTLKRKEIQCKNMDEIVHEKYIKMSVENSKNGLSYMHNMSVHFDN
jgi:hypothetical protein